MTFPDKYNYTESGVYFKGPYILGIICLKLGYSRRMDKKTIMYEISNNVNFISMFYLRKFFAHGCCSGRRGSSGTCMVWEGLLFFLHTHQISSFSHA